MELTYNWYCRIKKESGDCQHTLCLYLHDESTSQCFRALSPHVSHGPRGQVHCIKKLEQEDPELLAQALPALHWLFREQGVGHVDALVEQHVRHCALSRSLKDVF